MENYDCAKVVRIQRHHLNGCHGGVCVWNVDIKRVNNWLMAKLSESMRVQVTCFGQIGLIDEIEIRKRSRETCGKTLKKLLDHCASDDLKHNWKGPLLKLGKNGLRHHQDCRRSVNKLRN